MITPRVAMVWGHWVSRKETWHQHAGTTDGELHASAKHALGVFGPDLFVHRGHLRGGRGELDHLRIVRLTSILPPELHLRESHHGWNSGG